MDREGKMKVEDETARVVEMILNKESWTGRDLGYLAIANVATKFQQATRNEKTITPLVDSKRLQEMVDSLSGNDKELQVYSNYTAMYSWIMKRCQTAGVMMLKAKMECQNLSSIINEAIMVEDALKCAECSVVIEDSIQKALKNYSFGNIVTNKVDDVISSKSNLIKSLYYVLGVNTIIDLIAKVHKLPPVSMFKVPIEGICESIDKLKAKILDLKDKSLNAGYLNEDSIKTRIDFITSVFSDFDYRSLKISNSNKTSINSIIKHFDVFKSNEKTNDAIALACIVDNR
jgi:hypothetical protein